MTIVKVGLHSQQKLVEAALLQDDVRVVTLVCGRRWGKTTLAILMAARAAMYGQNAWYVAPTSKTQYQAATKLGQVLRFIRGVAQVRSQGVYRFSGGGRLVFRTIGEKAKLVGEGIDFLVADEAGMYPSWVWYESLRPALLDTVGKALLIGTPKGRNWFYTVYLRGVNGEPGYRSFHFPTWGNPAVSRAEVEKLRDELPERTFRQEILAEFVDLGGEVFRGLERVLRPDVWRETPEEGHEYVFGVDWGQSNDFTVITVLDMGGKDRPPAFVYYDRFNRIDYAFQVGRLEALVERWNPIRLIVEENSMGRPLVEELERRGWPVERFHTSNVSKQEAVQALALAIERGDVLLPDDPVMSAELSAFTAQRTASGAIRYAAPEGVHDDIVMSMLFAWSAMGTGARVLFMV